MHMILLKVWIISGASAGGTLSAAVSLKLRDRKVIPSLKLQVLVYPVLQSLDFNLPSYLENKNDPVLPRERMIAMWLLYARGLSHSNDKKCKESFKIEICNSSLDIN